MNARDIKDLMAMLSEATERQEALYIENEGEITAETEEMDAEIDAIKELLTTEGIDSLGAWLRAKEDEKKRYKAEKDYVTRKINATDKSIDYIKSLINQVMRETGVDKIKGELGYSFQTYTSDTTTVNKPNLFAKYEERLIDAMAKAGIKTLDTLVSKEGLGLTNGTCAMTSVGSLALYDTICAAQMGDIIGSMAFEGLTGLRNAFGPRIHQVRGQKGQMLVAANMRKLLAGSEILDNCQSDRVQDAYALRCIPQLHGACRDALEYVREKVEIELNAVTDNPLMFLDDEAVISGGNFHGEPMALPFDFLGIAASEIADASERRTERMVNPALSNGLTAFLTTQAGVNSGFMIVQYAAASMVSENKVYAHPASVDSIPSSANQEDIVSMGTTAARKAKMILQNTQDVLADELLTACQAIDIRRRLNTHGQGLTPLHEAIYQHVRKEVAFYEVDREIWPDIRAVEKMIRSGELLDIVKEYIPDFE